MVRGGERGYKATKVVPGDGGDDGNDSDDDDGDDDDENPNNDDMSSRWRPVQTRISDISLYGINTILDLLQHVPE